MFKPKQAAKTVALCLHVAILASCCRYPKGRVAMPVGKAPQHSGITIVAYGDTRTGPWGLGDNARQSMHGKVVDDIFASDSAIDGVIFTGDAVMTNFFLWKKSYWRCFLSQSDRFRAAGIPFYPSLGNHEVLPGVVPLMKAPASAPGSAPPGHSLPSDIEDRLAAAYDLGEEPTPNPQTPEAPASPEHTIDPNSERGQKELKEWERGISKGNVDDARKFGQFERHLQLGFYLDLEEDQRCGSDARTFADVYLTRAKYEYLRPLLRGRSYYSQVVEKGGVRVKLIALDTNCLDSAKQREFFLSEVKQFDGPIIVFGHHPPVNYDAEQGWPWDKVPGWGKRDADTLKSYFGNPEGRKIVLWVFGHVHDYQRRGPAGANAQAAAPVLLVAGGGGAPLDSTTPSFQWQPASWPAALEKAAYSQVKIIVTNENIVVETRGMANGESGFHPIDSFSIPLAQVGK